MSPAAPSRIEEARRRPRRGGLPRRSAARARGPESELNRVNGSESGVVVVSELFARVVRTALAAARSTGGLVDPTLGAAIEAAGYTDFSLLPDDDERPPGPPSPGRWPALRLDGRLLARPSGLHLDLNGVIKSLAVDEALGLIEGDGLVAAGGDVAVRGSAVVELPRAAPCACSEAASPRVGRPAGAGGGTGKSSTTCSSRAPAARRSRAGRR